MDTRKPPQAPAEPPFARRVIDWQRSHGRHRLPWQGTRDPYRVWLSEIMLQQTQVTTVLAYYERFLTRFPDVRSLAAASLDEVLALWSGLGYYSRARNLHRCAAVVASEHGGEFPPSSEALARLPGIGRSTAAAIAAFCFGERAAILDGNVRRVLARLLGFEGDLSKPAAERALWAQAEALLPAATAEAGGLLHGLQGAEDAGGRPGAGRLAPSAAAALAHDDIAAYTQGLMDLGAGVCTARAPACLVCPVAALCTARHEGAPERYPVRTRRATRTRRESWWLWLEWGGRVFLQQRPATGVWGGLWTLPLHDGAAALDEAAARLGVRAEPLPPIAHALTHFDWLLHPCHAVLRAEPPAGILGEGRWVATAELSTIALPAPLARLLAAGAPGARAPRGGVDTGMDPAAAPRPVFRRR